MRRLFLPVFLVLAGCADMSQQQCASADWAQLGERDGMAGLRPWIDQYGYQCSRHNVAAAEKDYMDGWRVGYAEWVRRADSHEGPN
jgi:hypothetical protein